MFVSHLIAFPSVADRSIRLGISYSSLALMLLVGGQLPTASGDEPISPAHLQASRRGSTVLLRKTARPALIDHLASEPEPVELEARDLLLLEAFLTANSRPRRLPRDDFYPRGFAVRGTTFDDPENLTLASSANVSRDEWQRLRTHLLFNRALTANKVAPPRDETARR